MRSSKADRVPFMTKGDLKCIAIFFLVIAALASLALVFGCQTIGTPPGYEADTTPGHNGEAWVGGETPPATN